MSGALEALPAEMGAAGEWEERGGASWLAPEALDVRRMAEVLVAHRARFITITARLEEDAPLRLTYHWDLDGRILNVETSAADGRVASIHDLCEAADWIEREIHEEYALAFDGRAHEPLLLRAGQAPGIHLPGDDE